MDLPVSAAVVQKARALLALSRSSNPHEAEAAARFAARLVEQHAIPEEDLIDMQEIHIAETPLDEVCDADPWRLHLATTLARSHGCHAFTRARLFFDDPLVISVAGTERDMEALRRDYRLVLLDLAWGGSLSYHLGYADARPRAVAANAARSVVVASVELADKMSHIPVDPDRYAEGRARACE